MKKIYVEYENLDVILFLNRNVKSRFSKKPIRMTRKLVPRLKITSAGMSAQNPPHTFSYCAKIYGELKLSDVQPET